MKTICTICKGNVKLDKKGEHWLHVQPYGSLRHDANVIGLPDEIIVNYTMLKKQLKTLVKIKNQQKDTTREYFDLDGLHELLIRIAEEKPFRSLNEKRTINQNAPGRSSSGRREAAR